MSVQRPTRTKTPTPPPTRSSQLQAATAPAKPAKAAKAAKPAKPEKPAKGEKPKGLTGLAAAIAYAQAEVDRPMFEGPQRRFIPMRHAALATLLGGSTTPGLPTGLFIEVKGGEHSGKTTGCFALADAVINQPEATCEMQAPGGVIVTPVPRKVLYIDFEQALDTPYMLRCIKGGVLARSDDKGRVVNLDKANLFVHQPDTLEQGVDVALSLLPTGEFGLVVMDSVAAMLAKAEAEKDMGENTMAEQARGMGKMFRKMLPLVRRYGCTVVLVNQWRDKIGVSFGDPRTSPGGKASAYYDSIILDVSGARLTPWFPEAGKVVTIKAMKNKVTGLRAQATYHLSNLRGGLSAEVELTEALADVGVLELSSPKKPVKLALPGAQVHTFANHEAWFTELARPGLFEKLAKLALQRTGGVYGSVSVGKDSTQQTIPAAVGGVVLPTA